MAAAAHPPETRKSIGPSPAPPPSCPRRPWVALLFPALGAEPPCGSAGQGAHGGARIPGPRAYARVRARSTCARPYWIHCPSHCLRLRAAAKKKARAEPGFSPCPGGAPQPNLPAGKSRRTLGGNYNVRRLATLASAGLGAFPPDTHPRALTPRRQPRPAAALVAQAPPAGGRAAIPGAQTAAGQPPRGRRAGREAGRWSWVLT